ncbi:head GIN domain-containing protein [Sphingomonas radiodurans]|uniref:head GIN domain-containing protein n=1 Tax=Sphingomonas radiodurans TaxID=2890321 RepID=UPI001E4B2EF9|nr:head GIN domain-containing protein [Sphingomonas radiodurans]WBH15154.1 DUF2807 domain-containing protein [Sphingomonas radiodurans]
MRAFVFALLMPLAACGGGWSDDESPGVPATGSGGTRNYAVADFTAVDQRGPDDVDVRVGAGFSVRAEGDPDVLDKVKIEQVGDALRIGRVRTAGFNWSSSSGAKIYVTMPRLTRATLAGSGDMAIDRVEGAAFDGKIAGSGALALGAVAVETLQLTIAGSGSVAARGEAATLGVSIAGSGDVDAAGLTARGATVKIAGTGSVKALVDGDAKVSIAGVGDVDLGPKARCQTKKAGSGEVRCGG